MKFSADLHVHSKFSRATSKKLDLERLYIAAQRKGIQVVGTGDFTHPGWFSEIREKLIPDESGLFKLRKDLSEGCDEKVPPICRGKVRFILSAEISNIYKKKGKTRKNHNLVCLPDLHSAEKFNTKLSKVGNIQSDGRPILGLDARNLLEILLDTTEEGYLIPAHIWTPWFSLLGSKSGFDSINECFGDLTPYIFAAETGLSSDPAMNWRVSSLDHLTLVSNSDAHSPEKLGREANLFDTAISFSGIKSAIKAGDPQRFLGTIEFFPEEGKYHLDGHRKCRVRFWPKATKTNHGRCPVCGKKLTQGVLFRVEELADRPEGIKPENAKPFFQIIPLKDALSEVLKTGPMSKKVKLNYDRLLDHLGAEFKILRTLPIETIESAGIPLLGEAIKRMRKKEITILPGYDGEFGTIKIFEEEEREKLLGQKPLFSMPTTDQRMKIPLNKTSQKNETTTGNRSARPRIDRTSKVLRQSHFFQKETILSELNTEQQEAVRCENGHLLIIAGPGTGKTLTLTRKIAYFIESKEIPPEAILAVTFTNKAAQEMNDRLRILLGESAPLPFVTTFHSLCHGILQDLGKEKNGIPVVGIIDDDDRKVLVSDAITRAVNQGVHISGNPKMFLDQIRLAKQQLIGPEDDLSEMVNHSQIESFSTVFRLYQNLLLTQQVLDYEELIFRVVKRLEADEKIREIYRDRFKHLFVDEYQDINRAQYRLIKLLVSPAESENSLCAIGDPDQSIYGFRGSDIRYFEQLLNDFPKTQIVRLTQNYRTTQTILKASFQIIAHHQNNTPKHRVFSKIDGLKKVGIFETLSEKKEAEAIANRIERQIGGTGYHSIDLGWIDASTTQTDKSFSDFAVLFRTNDQGRIIAEVFRRSGIPYQIVNRDNVYHFKGISEIISLLKILEGIGSYVDLERVLSGLGYEINKKSLTFFKNWAYEKNFSLKKALEKVRWLPLPVLNRKQQIKFNDFFKSISTWRHTCEGMSVEEKLICLSEQTKIAEKINHQPESVEILKRLVHFSQTAGDNTVRFLSSIALQKDTDLYDTRAEKVALMTIHAAKGLEFPVVFIAGCEAGYMPYERTGHQRPDVSEERRLFYVAMTRAKQELYLSWAKKRRIYGQSMERTLSPFIAEIEKKLIQHERSAQKRKKHNQIQLNLF